MKRNPIKPFAVIFIVYVLGIILLPEYWSGWFDTTPVWLTGGITVAVFLTACVINAVHIHQDLKEIHDKIKIRQKELGITGQK